MKIILASQSPRRKQLLACVVKDFTVTPSSINEDSFKRLARTPEELVVKLAVAKAKNVAKDYPNAVVIGADTIVVLPTAESWQQIGKPPDKPAARKMLASLRGLVHQVFTGVCVINTDTAQMQTTHVVSSVQFAQFSDTVLTTYVESGEPLDKAGGYGIQDVMGSIVKRYEGSLTNIIGLPMEELVDIFEHLGINSVIAHDWERCVKQVSGA